MDFQTCPVPKAEYANYFSTMPCSSSTTPLKATGYSIFFFFFLGERQPWSVTGGRWSSVLWWGQLGLDMVERGLENGNGKFSILKLSSPPLHKTTYLQVLTAYSLVQTYNLLNQCSGLLRGQQPNSHLATCSPHTGKSRTGMRKLTS